MPNNLTIFDIVNKVCDEYALIKDLPENKNTKAFKVIVKKYYKSWGIYYYTERLFNEIVGRKARERQLQAQEIKKIVAAVYVIKKPTTPAATIGRQLRISYGNV